MNIKQKQEVFDAITNIGYKETETLLLSFLNGEAFTHENRHDFMTILAWFNLWYNKNVFESDMEAVVRFIQSNTYSNPRDNRKKKKEKPLTEDFITEWTKRFGSAPIIE